MLGASRDLLCDCSAVLLADRTAARSVIYAWQGKDLVDLGLLFVFGPIYGPGEGS